MQILTRERRYETRGANPTLPWGSTVPPTNGSLGQSVGGVVVSDQTALQLAAVWASVSLLADSIAGLPIRQYKATGTNTAVEIDPSPVIQQPWSEITQRDFVTQGSTSLLLRGNLYGNITARDESNMLYPAQVRLVHPDHARIRRLTDGTIETRYWNQVVQPDNVTRAMALSLPEGLVGLNPVEHMRNVLGLARGQDLYGNAFYANQARPDGVINVPGDLDTTEAKAMKAAWLEAHQGINASHLPAVLTGGATFQPITMNMADVEFLAQMQFSDARISGMFYRIPPHMIGMTTKDTSWGSGIEQQQIGYVRDTLLIWLCRWEDLMRSWLPPRQFVTFDLSERLRGDTLQRWSAWQIARVIGAMSNEEIRAQEGLPVVTDPTQAAILQAFDAPLNSAPVKPTSTGGAGGDKSD